MPSSASPLSEIETHVRRVQNDLRKSTARVNAIDGAPASATGLIVIRGFKVEFANKILEQLYMNESSKGLATARSFRVASSKVALFQLVTCVISYFTTGRPLLFFAGAAIIQLTWSGLRPFLDTGRDAFLFNLICCAGVSCFLITDSFFDTVLTSHSIKLVPYAQESVGIEMGAAMLAIMVPVATFRVQLSWFRFVVLIWAAYFMTMILAIFPISNTIDKRKITLGIIISSILALISAFRLESLSRMFWILSASPSTITSSSSTTLSGIGVGIGAGVGIGQSSVITSVSNEASIKGITGLVDQSQSLSSILTSANTLSSPAAIADSTAFPSRKGALSFFLSTSSPSQTLASSLSALSSPHLSDVHLAFPSTTNSVHGQLGQLGQHITVLSSASSSAPASAPASSLSSMQSMQGTGERDDSNPDQIDNENESGDTLDDIAFLDYVGLSGLSRMDREAFFRAGIDALDSLPQCRLSQQFEYPISTFTRFISSDLVISHASSSSSSTLTDRRRNTQHAKIPTTQTPLEMCLCIIRWIQEQDNEYIRSSDDDIVRDEEGEFRERDIDTALTLLAGIITATPDLHIDGLTSAKVDDLDEQTRLWVTAELVGNKRRTTSERVVTIVGGKSPILGPVTGTGLGASNIGVGISGPGHLSERRRGSLGSITEGVKQSNNNNNNNNNSHKHSSLSMSVSAMTAIILKDGEVTSIRTTNKDVTTSPLHSPTTSSTTPTAPSGMSLSANSDQISQFSSSIFATASTIDSSSSPTSIPSLPQDAFLSPSLQSTRRRSDGNRSGGTSDSNGKSSNGGGDIVSLLHSQLVQLLPTTESISSTAAWYQNPHALVTSMTPSVSPAERPLLWLESATTPVNTNTKTSPPPLLLLPISEATVITPIVTSVPEVVDEEDLLERLLVVTQWDFDVFGFNTRVGGRALTFVSHELFTRFELFSPQISSSRSLSHYRGPGVKEDVFARFVTQLEKEYCFDPNLPNPYHTSLHAADVVQAVGAFLVVPRLSSTLSQTDALCVLLAAMIHDFRHPGLSNTFLVKTNDKIAIQYNDESVLENFHSAEGFSLLHRDGVGGRFDILGCLSDESRRAARFLIIKLILATDLANGAKITSSFKSRLSMAHTMGETEDDKLLVMQQMIKCADVSHPARSLEVHEKWSALISEEFYKQGDLERQIGLSVSPLCDREAHNLAKSQIGFIEFVVKPAFVTFSAFCEVDTWTACLFENLQHWKNVANNPIPPISQLIDQLVFEDIPKVEDIEFNDDEDNDEEEGDEEETKETKSILGKNKFGSGIKKVSWLQINVPEGE